MLVRVGTGVGAGLVLEGVLLHGHRSAAGEVGHVVIDPDGAECAAAAAAASRRCSPPPGCASGWPQTATRRAGRGRRPGRRRPGPRGRDPQSARAGPQWPARAARRAAAGRRRPHDPRAHHAGLRRGARGPHVRPGRRRGARGRRGRSSWPVSWGCRDDPRLPGAPGAAAVVQRDDGAGRRARAARGGAGRAVPVRLQHRRRTGRRRGVHRRRAFRVARGRDRGRRGGRRRDPAARARRQPGARAARARCGRRPRPDQGGRPGDRPRARRGRHHPRPRAGRGRELQRRQPRDRHPELRVLGVRGRGARGRVDRRAAVGGRGRVRQALPGPRRHRRGQPPRAAGAECRHVDAGRAGAGAVPGRDRGRYGGRDDLARRGARPGPGAAGDA